MSSSLSEQDLQRIQSAAERVDGASSLPAREVEAYRWVYRAIREAPVARPPADFARSLEQLSQDHTEQADAEIWLTRLPLALLSLACLASVLRLPPTAAPLLIELFDRFGAVAVGALLALMTAVLIDRLAGSSAGPQVS